MAMHGEHMEAHPPMGLKGGSGEGGERSYQVPSKVQDEVGQSMRREDEVPKRLAGMHGGAWDSASSSTWSMRLLHSVRQIWLPMSTLAIMHGDAWGAHEGPATNRLKGDSGEGGGQSYKVRGEVWH